MDVRPSCDAQAVTIDQCHRVEPVEYRRVRCSPGVCVMCYAENAGNAGSAGHHFFVSDSSGSGLCGGPQLDPALSLRHRYVMATNTQTLVTVTDDIDGKEGAETVAFSFDGLDYQVDLGEKNRAKLAAALRPYIEVGRRVGGRAKRTTTKRRSTNALDASAVRAWAADNGYRVSPRGRVRNEVIEAYRDAGH